MRYRLLLLLLIVALGVQAQKSRTSRRKSAKTTKVTKKPVKQVVPVPFDSIAGKAYAGKIGRTVVDFFGTRNVYGDVIQEVYVWNDSIACIRQMNGSEVEFLFPVITYSDNTLKAGPYTYTVTDGGASLQLQSMTQNNEKREGKLSSSSVGNILSVLYVRGKYLDGMTIQTDEDKRNALICLTAAAQGNVDGVRETLEKYYKKRADNGEQEAMQWMVKAYANAGNYDLAHEYVDKLIELSPDDAKYQCDKGILYLAEKKDKDAKKLWKKIQKKYSSYIKTSSHPFVERMR